MTPKNKGDTDGGNDGHKDGNNDGDNDVWKRDEIQSPCTKVCVIHPEAKLCIGCLRTTDEIAGWSRLTHKERADIIATLRDREPRLKNKRRGGRNKRG